MLEKDGNLLHVSPSICFYALDRSVVTQKSIPLPVVTFDTGLEWWPDRILKSIITSCSTMCCWRQYPAQDGTIGISCLDLNSRVGTIDEPLLQDRSDGS